MENTFHATPISTQLDAIRSALEMIFKPIFVPGQIQKNTCYYQSDNKLNQLINFGKSKATWSSSIWKELVVVVGNSL